MKSVNRKRREWCLLGLALALPVHAQSSKLSKTTKPLVEVWKSPYCGCCKDWVTHLQKNGFAVKVTETVDTASQREKLGMPAQYGSCHTARVGGYVIEGHVPAREMHRLLKEKPKALGLAVPAMPIGSPGIDGPQYGNRRDAYDVLLVEQEGRVTVYQSY
ncbi:MAG: DUF411 domain-containing protein [Burkholderiales bacterium]|jgi:hypothetical protein